MFKSSNFIFRQTALGQALDKIGLGNGSQVRDERISGELRHPRDRFGSEPNRHVHLDPIVETPGAFGKKEKQNG